MTRQQSGGDHGRMPHRPIHDEKQPTAARALAGIGIRELAAAADIAPGLLHRFAPGGVIPLSEKTAMAVCAPCGYGLWPLLQQPVSNSWRKAGIVRRHGALDGAAEAPIA